MENVNKTSTSIKKWAIDDRPSEKIKQKGVAVLSNAELLAILVRTGNSQQSAVELAQQILGKCHDNLVELSKITLYELKKIKGMGEMKSLAILAAMELSRRKQASRFLEKIIIKSSAQAATYLCQSLKDLPYEAFAVLYLNRANKIIHFEMISKGGITGTIADPRIILKIALEHGATSIIISHNHPSGNLQPSKADEEITHKIREAAKLIDVVLLDHIIISEEGYYSFMDEGKL